MVFHLTPLEQWSLILIFLYSDACGCCAARMLKARRIDIRRQLSGGGVDVGVSGEKLEEGKKSGIGKGIIRAGKWESVLGRYLEKGLGYWANLNP